MNLQSKTVDGEIHIRDLDLEIKGGQSDIMAIIPLSDDEAYNTEVVDPFVQSICNIPAYLRAIEAAEQLVQTLGLCEDFLKLAEVHIHERVDVLRKALKRD